MYPTNAPKKKASVKKEHIDFEVKLTEALEDRNQKIADLKKEILSFMEKHKIDDRDAKTALREALKELKVRCEIDKL